MPHFFAQSRIFEKSTYNLLCLGFFSQRRSERIRSTSTGSSSKKWLLKDRWSSFRSDRPADASEERVSEKSTPGPNGQKEARVPSTAVVSKFRPFPGDERDTFLDDATSIAGIDGSEEGGERVVGGQGGVVATPAGRILRTVGYGVNSSVRTDEETTQIAREIFNRRGVRFHRLA